MVLTPGTIHDVLARKNPDLEVLTGKGGNTKENDWVDVNYDSLRPWRDFSYQHLMNGWGHILSIEGAKGKYADELSNSQKQIIDEDKIDSVAEMWNVECLRDPLKRGAKTIRGTSVPDITIKKKYMQYAVPNKKRSLEPDMAIFLRDGDRKTSTTLVMGDNKCATKWSHLGLTPSKSPEPLWPVRQILTYCFRGKTRYGYIMTTSEVVVFRVSKNPSTSEKTPYLVEWTFVPWSNSGEGKLTVNLAIWWLGMMSLAEKHRQIVLPARMYPINTWQKYKAKDGTVKYIHLLSRRTVGALPSGDHQID